jgi:hypothetical protein
VSQFDVGLGFRVLLLSPCVVVGVCLGLACFGPRVVVFFWDRVPDFFYFFYFFLECVLFWCSIKDFIHLIYIYISKHGVMLEVSIVSFLCPSNNDVTFKIIIGVTINHY